MDEDSAVDQGTDRLELLVNTGYRLEMIAVVEQLKICDDPNQGVQVNTKDTSRAEHTREPANSNLPLEIR